MTKGKMRPSHTKAMMYYLAVYCTMITGGCKETPLEVTKNTVGMPTFSLASGTYTTPQIDTMRCSTVQAIIRYTLDGSTPSENNGQAIKSGDTVRITSTSTLKAIAYVSGWNPSTIDTAFYIITGTVAAPVCTPAGGTYSAPQSVTISCLTPQAIIRYTLDESVPSLTNGTLYTTGDTLHITASTTLKAIAYLSGWTSSDISSQVYTLVKYIQFNGQAFGLFQSDTLYADGATITLDNSLSVTAQSDGKFSVDPISQGNHHMSISHSWFQLLDTTITINDSLLIPIPLNPMVQDYLPLKIGNTWIYSYEKWNNDNTSGATDIISGTDTWKITNVEQTDSCTIYAISNIFDGSHIITKTYPTPSRDSSGIHNESVFNIVEWRNHKITITNWGSGSGVEFPYNLINSRFNRLNNPIVSGDKIQLVDISGGTSYVPLIYINKLIGITEWGWVGNPGNHPHGVNSVLTSHIF
jgi:hypothetical protein